MNFLEIFRKRRIKLIKKEIAEKKKLCAVQKDLNELLREQNEIESN